MKRTTFWIVIVAVLLLLNTLVMAMLWFRKPGQGPQGAGSAKDFLQRELNLTTDQQQEYSALREDHQHKIKALMNGMKDLKDALVEKISASQPDSAGIELLTKKISEKERQRDLLTVYHFRAFKQILNPEQQKKFEKVLKEVMRIMNGPQRPPQAHPLNREEIDERPPSDPGEMPPL
jgi:Spy/CpxP family protein refolding chaperone